MSANVKAKLYVKNNTIKPIGFGKTVILPDQIGELPDGFTEEHPTIKFYFQQKFIVKVDAVVEANKKVEATKAEVDEAAAAKAEADKKLADADAAAKAAADKAEAEKAAAAKAAELDAKIKEVAKLDLGVARTMATELGIAWDDKDTVVPLRNKIIEHLKNTAE